MNNETVMRNVQAWRQRHGKWETLPEHVDARNQAYAEESERDTALRIRRRMEDESAQLREQMERETRRDHGLTVAQILETDARYMREMQDLLESQRKGIVGRQLFADISASLRRGALRRYRELHRSRLNAYGKSGWKNNPFAQLLS